MRANGNTVEWSQKMDLRYLLKNLKRMKISPSILDANFQYLQTEIDSIATADRIHLDIMDGQYVPGITFGAALFRQLQFPVETEVHLMVDNPERQFEAFQAIGVSGITFHIENTGEEKAVEYLKHLKSMKLRAGICVDGHTPQNELSDEILTIADQILLMSVKAGKGGQFFMPEVLDKIKILRERGFKGEIEVDGGVNLENAVPLKEAGVDIVVVGSFLMKKDEQTRKDIIQQFQSI